MTRPRGMCLVFVMCAVVLLGYAVAAYQDPEPAKDHPSVPRFPGMLMSSGTSADFNGYEFQVSSDSATIPVRSKSRETMQRSSRRAAAR